MFQHRKLDSNACRVIRDYLTNTDWNLLNDLSVDDSFTKFSETIGELIDLFAPMQSVIIPVNRVIRQPWITKGILKSSATLDKLY